VAKAAATQAAPHSLHSCSSRLNQMPTSRESSCEQHGAATALIRVYCASDCGLVADRLKRGPGRGPFVAEGTADHLAQSVIFATLGLRVVRGDRPWCSAAGFAEALDVKLVVVDL